MPLQPIADTPGASDDRGLRAARGLSCAISTGFSHVWVLAHLHETLGWDATVPAFLDDEPRGTFATRSPRRPNPIGISLTRIVGVGADAVVVDGLDLLDGTPVLDLKPFVPLFDTPSGDVRRLVRDACRSRLQRTSDDRFALRSAR